MVHRKFADAKLVDGLGKRWQTHFIQDGNTLIVYADGYDRLYPLDLTEDDKFILEINTVLRSMGYRGPHLDAIGHGAQEGELMFKKNKKLTEFFKGIKTQID